MVKSMTKYKCCECGMVWDDDWEADNCCKPRIEEVLVYYCDDCDQEYETKKGAFECCKQTKL